MKRKLKAIFAALIGAFVFLMVGAVTVVDAVETTNTYTFDLSTWESIKKENAGSKEYSMAGDKITDISMPLKYSQSSLKNASKYNSTYYQIGAAGGTNKEWFKFEFALKGSGSVIFKYNTGGGSKFYDYKVDDLDTIQIVSGSEVTKTNRLEAGTHTLLFTGTSSSTSNFKLYSFIITDTVESGLSNEDLAVNAISNIGTVEYTDSCKTKIDEAKLAIEKCSNPSSETISNYLTYTEAVSSYNSLADEAVNQFIAAVESIGTVTANSKDAINTATNSYNKLLSNEKDNDGVKSAKTTLDSKNKEYMMNFGKKSISIVIDEADKALCSTYSEDTILYTSEESSIFSGTKNTSIENQNSSKTYDGVKFFDRFKTNGMINIENGVISNAFKISATEAGIVELVAISGNSKSTRNIKICKAVEGNLEVIKNLGNVVSGSNASLYTLPIPSAGDYYIGSDTFDDNDKEATAGGINIYKATFTSKSIETPILEQQETTDGTSIRYVCTLGGIVDLSQVTSWTVTMSMEGKSDYVKTFDVFYSAVGGTNGKDKFDYTWYLVATLTNVKSSYNGQVISTKFTLNLADGTIINSNVKEYTINVIE